MISSLVPADPVVGRPLWYDGPSWHQLIEATSRRRLLAGGLGAGAAILLGACDSPSSPTTNGSGPPDGPFTYTDSRGEEIKLPSRPRRIVAQVGAAAALWDLGVRPVGIFGPSRTPDGAQDPQSGSVDLSTVTSLGNAWDEFNIEQYAGLTPDLLVSVTNAGELWYVPEASADKIAALAPTLGIAVDDAPLPVVIERFITLAKALGADVATPAVAAAKTAYDQADAEFGTAAQTAKTAGLRVAAATILEDVLYLAKPSAFANLRHFADRGLPFVPLDAADEFWEGLSWETVDKYPLDVILLDKRTQSTPAADLAAQHPTWAQLPAVRANQLLPWYSEAQYSYQGYLPQLRELTAGLRTARKVT